MSIVQSVAMATSNRKDNPFFCYFPPIYLPSCYLSFGNRAIAVLKRKRSNSADDSCNSESLFTFLIMKFRVNEMRLDIFAL